MLVIESDSILDSFVADGIAVSEILGYDARAWLVFLRKICCIAGCIFCVGSCQLFYTSSAGDLDLGVAKLGIVKEEGCLCCSKWV